MIDRVSMAGVFCVKHIRDGLVLAEHVLRNTITNIGKTDMLNDYLGTGGIAGGQWFFGLIDNATFSSTNVADTLASHSGWTELFNYPGNRLAWPAGTAANKIIDSTGDAVFTFNATGSVKGFLVASVPSGTGGILWSTVTLAAPTTVAVGDKYVVSSYRVTVT